MGDDNAVPKSHDVAVLGCGLMGSALARAFAENGYSVAAWNRRPERAEALAGERIEPLSDIAAAVRSSRLVVACLTTYDTTLAALAPVPDWTDTALVNIASGAPDDVVMMDGWAKERGAEYLDASVICYPDDIGTPEAAILYSGSATAWAEHEKMLMSVAGSSGYVSDQATAASVLNVGLVGAFVVPTLGAYVEAATYVLQQGVAPEVLGLLTHVTLEEVRKATDEIAAGIASGEHATAQATISTYAEGVEAALAVLHGSGHSARLLAAATENLSAASAAGLGGLGLSALSQVAAAAEVEAR